MPPEPWNESWAPGISPRLATKHGRVCPQPYDITFLPPSEGPGPFAGAEDCLFLNIFTPSSGEMPTPGSLPVMVFIHGGSFISGASNALVLGKPSYDAAQLALHNVVCVTINYRLGVLGWTP